MKKHFLKIIMLAVTSFMIVSCDKDEKDDDTTPTATFGEFNLDMEYVWAMSMSPFTLNQMLYHPMTGDSLNFSTMKHYISNIKLKRSNGTYWVANESYHLMDASVPSSLSLNFTNVPSGEYVAMEVTFGVDSARNVSGAQVGALDPANGMFWSWTTGYIMIKAEGTSPQSSNGTFSYHLGGFSGSNSTVSVRELSFPGGVKLTIGPSLNPTVHMMANPARLFHSYGSVSNGEMIHMPGANAKTMASDFNNWVMIDQIDN